MKPYSFDIWYNEYFDNNINISFEDFCEKATVENKKSLMQHFEESNRKSLKKDNTTDFRWLEKDRILELLYDVTITNRKNTLYEWFMDHINILEVDKYLKFGLETDKSKMLKTDDNFTIINGKHKNNINRFIKNIYPFEIYNTAKIYREPTFVILNKWFNDLNFLHLLVGPMFLKALSRPNKKRVDWHDIWAIVRGVTDSASIFNPHLAGWIIQNIYKGKKLLTPVMGWSAYMIGFLNTDWEEYVGIDVIPEVIENSNEIWNYRQSLNPSNFLFGDDTKKLKLFCTPSEQMDKEHNFSNKYKNYFDGIFFSPPYFDLEKYEYHKGLENTQQSIANFENYEDWLKGYWEPTVAMCSRVMNEYGNFGFVISNFKDKKVGLRTISEDMHQICLKYFKLETQYKIQWSNFTKRAKKSDDGNYEDFWFYRKK